MDRLFAGIGAAAYDLQSRPRRQGLAGLLLIQLPGPRTLGHGTHIKIGYEFIYDCPQPTPMVLMLTVHHTGGGFDGASPAYHRPAAPSSCLLRRLRLLMHRVVTPAGRTRLSAEGLVSDCRCMNIPARYCTGYLGDIGVPSDSSPKDFSAWFEVYLGAWHIFDARHNHPRIGRVLIASGRADVAIAAAFGPNTQAGFKAMTRRLQQLRGIGTRRDHRGSIAPEKQTLRFARYDTPLPPRIPVVLYILSELRLDRRVA